MLLKRYKMIQLKSEQDIESLAAGGKLLAEVLDELEAMVEPGMTGLQLEDVAQVRMKEMGVTPAFQGYASGGHDPYPFALCVSVNEAVVHGMPNDAPFDEGDIVGVDAGLVYEDKYYLDSARTIPVGTVTNEAKNLLDITKESLSIGIAEATVGAYVGDIGAAVQEYVEGQGLWDMVSVLVCMSLRRCRILGNEARGRYWKRGW